MVVLWLCMILGSRYRNMSEEEKQKLKAYKKLINKIFEYMQKNYHVANGGGLGRLLCTTTIHYSG